jgi:hypothetical protein
MAGRSSPIEENGALFLSIGLDTLCCGADVSISELIEPFGEWEPKHEDNFGRHPLL